MSELANDEFDKDYWFEMYQGQCKTTDEWAKKYRDEVERKADATLLARCEELQRIAEVANAMVGKERDQTMRQAKRITELEAQLKAAPFGDPYQGAREDLLMWKRDCEVLRQELDANKGALILSARKCKELEASLADSNEALQVMGLKLAHAEGHSANTVGGPTPVMDAAPACEQPS